LHSSYWRIDLKEARDNAKPFETALDSARVAREAAEARTDSILLAHKIDQDRADSALAVADSGRIQAERDRGRLANQARELAKNQPALVALIDSLEATGDRTDQSYDSLRVEYTKLEQKYDEALVTFEDETETLRGERDAALAKSDYWEDTAIEALSRRDFDLFAFIPKGPLRAVAKGVACGAVGAGVGLLANAADSRPPDSGTNTAAVVGGVGAGGACVLATVAF
jgi:hypothetical protein